MSITRVDSTVRGNCSGNNRNNNVFGSNNTIRNTPYCLIPYGRNGTFTGRKNHLELIKKLSERTAHNRIALYGVGGSGKTQIALEYVYQRTIESDCHVFWVQGSGLLKFSEGFRAVAQQVQIPLASAETDEGGLLRSIKSWLEGPHSGNWILVIDNADNVTNFTGSNSAIAKFIPQGTKGTVIFTTRSKLVASRQRCERIEVGKMEEEDAQELFLKRVGSRYSLGEEEKKAVTMILASVHHLPLAIIDAAAFMTETETPPSAYWTILQESDERAKRLLSQQFSDIQREADEPESILGTYFTMFNQITQQMPRAVQLLRLISCLDRQNISEELLCQSRLEGMDDSLEFRRAMGKLLGFSVIGIVKCGEERFYELDPLVQLSLQAYLPSKELRQARAAALKAVSRMFPQDESEQRSVGHIYIQHALVVTKNATGHTAEDLRFRIGQYFRAKGSYSDAEMQFRRCIALGWKGNGDDWDGGGQRKPGILGVASTDLGNAKAPVEIFQNSQCSPGISSGPNSVDVLKYMDSLAVVLQDQGKEPPEDSRTRPPGTLASTNNLAVVLQDQEKYEESEKMHRRALESRKKILGPDHPDTLTSANNLALVLQAQGKEPPEDSRTRPPGTLASTNNLAVVLQDQEKYEESEKMHRRALENREKILGLDHPDTLASTNNLALVLQVQGKYDKSEMMYRRTLESRDRILGPDHPDTLATAKNLAVMLRYQGKYDKSEMMHWQAQDRLLRKLDRS
ncbi:TPR-like protein [Tuber magnatum]|uniref:TPR-like protein n=1 Tax=Tuber magnatum TaxID=42249 RepID=A0A317SMU1_9PEZI|nr:TPR-like protein [Tuber magnatum]